MFRHTLLLAYRSFLRFKSTFFINLIGLSTGLAGALLIYLWVSDELAVDKFHEKDSRLYQVMQNVPTGDDRITTMDSTPGLLGEAMLAEIPEVEKAVVVAGGPGRSKGILAVANARFKASELYVPQSFFTTFSYKLTQGNKERVLQDKRAVVVSAELALKLFGSTENIIGKVVEWEQGDFSGPYVISGIFQKPPANSSEQFDLLFNYETYFDKEASGLKDWQSNYIRTYLLLKEETNLAGFQTKLKDFIKTKNKESTATLFLQRYSDRYLYNIFENGIPAGGRIAYVKLFSFIAIFILAIACINFMNLSTAKATRRLKEIGIKKVIGANRKTLIMQYMGESLLLTLLALAVAVLLVILLLPQFNQITGKQLGLHLEVNLILAVLSVTLVTGLVSGSYPAFYLSGLKPITVLKGKLNTVTGGTWARQGLVVFQFAVSVILIVAVLVIYQQIKLIQTKNLGYNKDNIIYFASEGKLRESREPFLEAVKKLPGVVDAASMGGNLTGKHTRTSAFEWPGKSPSENTDFSLLSADYDLIQTLGVQVLAGRSFSRSFGADSATIIFNEAAIARMGLPDPIGKTIKLWGEEKQIIGIVKDFHFESLYEKVKPVCFIYKPKWADQIMVKIAVGTERATLERIGLFYKEFNQGLPLDYKFLDEDYQAQYAAEQRVAILSRYFAGVAVLISCLGLFGLAAFTAERRRKEIGVRKVLGASRFNIVYLLSSDFTKLVVVSISIALPLSYLIVKHWLQNFEYRIDLQWWYFVGAGLAALLVAWLTVSTQAVKAASVNPAQSLKEE